MAENSNFVQISSLFLVIFNELQYKSSLNENGFLELVNEYLENDISLIVMNHI